MKNEKIKEVETGTRSEPTLTITIIEPQDLTYSS